MSSINPFNNPLDGDWVKNPVTLIDKMIGNAYDVVKHVACNMQYIRHVSHYMKSIYDLAQNPIGTVVVSVLLDTKVNKTAVLPVKIEAVRGFSILVKTPENQMTQVSPVFMGVGAVGEELSLLVDPALPDVLIGSTVYISVSYDWKVNGASNG